MSIKSRVVSSITEWYESLTGERTLSTAPVRFTEDFLGKAFDTTNIWTARDTGAATEALVASGANGLLALTLDATNEAQLAGIDWGDSKTLVLNQGLVFEARFCCHVLPTTGVVAVIGLCSSHNAAVDSVATSLWFRLDASGAITVETDDGTTETSRVSTGVTVVADEYVVARIDATDPEDVRFYLDGEAVALETGFNVNATPTVALQPVARIGKESAATSLGTLYVDSVKIAQNRA